MEKKQMIRTPAFPRSRIILVCLEQRTDYENRRFSHGKETKITMKFLWMNVTLLNSDKLASFPLMCSLREQGGFRVGSINVPLWSKFKTD